MSDDMKVASAFMDAQRTAYYSGAVVYSRGADSVTVDATIGKTIFRIDNAYGISERTEARDYLILVVDLILDSVETLPEPGDKIAETDGDILYTYEVMAPGGEDVWRYSDPYRRTLRIHTKLVDKGVIS